MNWLVLLIGSWVLYLLGVIQIDPLKGAMYNAVALLCCIVCLSILCEKR
jgi:hypothetical protein